MMKKIGFGEFVARLPEVSNPPEPQSPRPDWFPAPKESPWFVEPHLREESSSGAEPRVIIVSAAGAVGKTTVAEELSRRTGAPRFNLSTRHVGSNTFLGLIGSAYGPAKVSQVYESLKSGQLFLILDALDEARVRSLDTNFEPFAQELAQYCAGFAKPALVLMARPDTAVLMQLYLESMSVPAISYAIELFDRGEAKQFVNRYLDR